MFMSCMKLNLIEIKISRLLLTTPCDRRSRWRRASLQKVCVCVFSNEPRKPIHSHSIVFSGAVLQEFKSVFKSSRVRLVILSSFFFSVCCFFEPTLRPSILLSSPLSLTCLLLSTFLWSPENRSTVYPSLNRLASCKLLVIASHKSNFGFCFFLDSLIFADFESAIYDRWMRRWLLIHLHSVFFQLFFKVVVCLAMMSSRSFAWFQLTSQWHSFLDRFVVVFAVLSDELARCRADTSIQFGRQVSGHRFRSWPNWTLSVLVNKTTS